MYESPTRSQLIERINEARTEKAISIRTAAKIAGVPPATVQGWLSGRHFPTPALRPKFLTLVTELELGHLLHPALWLEDGRGAGIRVGPRTDRVVRTWRP